MRELDTHMAISSLLELSTGEIGEFCESALDVSTLLEELEDYAPFPLSSRKGFCEFLGVGESTLTGWLKEKRIPRMAKEAYVLANAFGELQKEVKRLRQEADDLKIIDDGGKFSVVQFTESAGSMVGHIVARDIPNAKTARFLAASIPSFRLLQETKGVIIDMLERTENPAYIRELERLQMEITKQTLKTFDPVTWLEVFEKKLSVSVGDLDLSALGLGKIGEDGPGADKAAPSSNDATKSKG